MKNPIKQYIKRVARQHGLQVRQSTTADRCSLTIVRKADGSVIFDKSIEERTPETAWETLWIWAWHPVEKATATTLYGVMRGIGKWH